MKSLTDPLSSVFISPQLETKLIEGAFMEELDGHHRFQSLIGRWTPPPVYKRIS
jgi:hypothetical protein